MSLSRGGRYSRPPAARASGALLVSWRAPRVLLRPRSPLRYLPAPIRTLSSNRTPPSNRTTVRTILVRSMFRSRAGCGLLDLRGFNVLARSFRRGSGRCPLHLVLAHSCNPICLAGGLPAVVRVLRLFSAPKGVRRSLFSRVSLAPTLGRPSGVTFGLLLCGRPQLRRSRSLSVASSGRSAHGRVCRPEGIHFCFLFSTTRKPERPGPKV